MVKRRVSTSPWRFPTDLSGPEKLFVARIVETLFVRWLREESVFLGRVWSCLISGTLVKLSCARSHPLHAEKLLHLSLLLLIGGHTTSRSSLVLLNACSCISKYRILRQTNRCSSCCLCELFFSFIFVFIFIIIIRRIVFNVELVALIITRPVTVSSKNLILLLFLISRIAHFRSK